MLEPTLRTAEDAFALQALVLVVKKQMTNMSGL